METARSHSFGRAAHALHGSPLIIMWPVDIVSILSWEKGL